MVVALGWAYVRYGGLAWMQAVFYGVGAAVIGIIACSAYRLTRKTLGEARLLWAIYLVSAIATAITETEDVRLILAGGVVVWLARSARRQGWLGGAPALLLAPAGVVGVGLRPAAGGSSLSLFTPARSCSAAGWRSCRSCTAAW